MIVKNEARNLEASIAPVRELVDEIVVVDTGSTDDTVAIAERLGAKVFHFAWCDSFSAARNAAIEHATGDWIFVLDADDRMVPSEVAKLRALFAKLGDENVGYLMGHVCLSTDGGVGVEAEQVRLFPRRTDIRWRYRAHEQVMVDLLASGGNCEPTGIRVVHVGFQDPSLVTHKLERNLRLVEMDCADLPTDPFPMFYRGVMLADLGRSTEAIVTLSLCAPLVDPNSPIACWLAHALANAYHASGQFPDALETVRNARRVFPIEPALASLEAELLVELGDLPGAGAALVGVATHDVRDLNAQHLRARTLFAEVMLVLGHHEAAEHTARVVIAAHAAFGAAWLVLTDALLAQGHLDALEEVARGLGGLRGGDMARSLIDVARLAHAGRTGDARHALEQLSDTGSVGSVKGMVGARLLKTGWSVPFLSCLEPCWSRGAAPGVAAALLDHVDLDSLIAM